MIKTKSIYYDDKESDVSYYDLSQRRGWALPGWRLVTLVQCLRCHWCLQIVLPGLERLIAKRTG